MFEKMKMFKKVHKKVKVCIGGTQNTRSKLVKFFQYVDTESKEVC